ncbi:hypothetical protein KSP39_PZI009020 [Platanthera zijinensis]|uniref:C3H1-type domain-containing protein n=1 Tax=Platanthera zijinensis TaxID=2320716 RepID=A0AAP0G7U0_9ASPA
MELRESSDSDETIGGSAGSGGSRADLHPIARRRFSTAAPSPIPAAFTVAAGSGRGSFSSSPLSMEGFLLHLTQSRVNRLRYSSSSSSSNDTPDSGSPSAMAAQKRLQKLLNLRSSLTSSSQRCHNQSPLSPIENLQQALPITVRSSSPAYSVYRTPMKAIEEEVLVMDALGESYPTTCRARKPLDLHSSSSSSSSGPNFFKTEICRSWEERGSCRSGFRCQFAHGKEELRGTAGFSKLKPLECGKQLSAAGSGGYCNKLPTYAPTLIMMDSAIPSSDQPPSSSSAITAEVIAARKSTAGMEKMKGGVSGARFSWPPTEDEEASIQRILYGPSRRRRSRLPIFQSICPDSEK